MSDFPPGSPISPGARLRRVAPLLLVAGGLLAWQLVGPHVPTDRTVTLRLGDAAKTVTSIDVAWRAPGESEPQSGTSLRFREGSAPRAIETRVRLAPATWDLVVDVERTARGTEQIVRRVDLGAGDVTVPLEDALR